MLRRIQSDVDSHLVSLRVASQVKEGYCQILRNIINITVCNYYGSGNMSQFKQRSFPVYLLGLAVLFFLVSAVESAKPWSNDPATFSVEERAQALAAAREYAEIEYLYDDQPCSGVAYLNGGQDTVAEYLTELEAGAIPGVDIGIDASGLVINAYKSVYPGLRLVYQSTSEKRSMVSDASSQTIYQWNVERIEPEALTLGDLIFFGTSPNRISGVGLYAGRLGRSIRVIIASASQQKVVETGIIFGGDYWTNNVVGAGRLIKW